MKHKKTNGRTSKKRFRLNDETGFNAAADHVVAPNTPFHKEDLLPRLGNRFNRVTLVNRARTERLTLDFNLQFDSVTDDGASKSTPVFEQAVIVELKQDRKSGSAVARRMKDENIRKCGMSKYCVGMLLLNSDLSCKMYKRNFMKFLNTTQWTL